jgi:hypothetical protein
MESDVYDQCGRVPRSNAPREGVQQSVRQRERDPPQVIIAPELGQVLNALQRHAGQSFGTTGQRQAGAADPAAERPELGGPRQGRLRRRFAMAAPP